MLAISAMAIILAILKVPGLSTLRYVAVFFALGCGQIHLAVVALITLLVVENGYTFPRSVHRNSTLALLMFLISVVFVTFLSPINRRVIAELVQLFTYAFIFILFVHHFRQSERIQQIWRSSAIAALLVAVLGIMLNKAGATSSPHIYLGRGGNEGSMFLLICGVIPTMTLFVMRPRLVYLAIATIIIYAQILATSRANIAMSTIVVLSPILFLIQARWLRILTFLGLVGFIIAQVSLLQSAFVEQQNYSVLQRFALYEAGWSLWLDRPWVGWGWGATSQIAPQTSLTDETFPHFHSTYIQFIVELGLLGWVINVLYVLGAFALISITIAGKLARHVSFYIAVSCGALLGAGLTEAMLFGADRAVQVVLVLAVFEGLLHRKSTRFISSRTALDSN